jgi:UDP-N-acetylglucosamine:LPS N-acetylglucosamine transferase
MKRTESIFNNPVPVSIQRKALKAQAKHLRKFGDDRQTDYPLIANPNPTIGKHLGLQNIEIGTHGSPIDPAKGVIVGNIRMGFGHYRIAMAIASAANALGYTPYWFDLNAYAQTTGGKLIAHLNALYSMGSRWSQKYPLFNTLFWEPYSAQAFRQLKYNAQDQAMTELMTPVYQHLPKDMPFIGTHVWPAQAAVHAGLSRVINVIPDNWPMALHLAEGSIHTVQTPSCYQGYLTLNGMDPKKTLNPMPADQLVNTGHYIDHELLKDLKGDTAKRVARLKNGEALRVLMTIGGAGAQQEIYAQLIRDLLPAIQRKNVTLLINVGDHRHVWTALTKLVPALNDEAVCHFDAWEDTVELASTLLKGQISGIHVFYHQDIFAAVYATNLLMRGSDVLVTKPSELAYYPIPKLMIKRVGGHEAWGAIRAAEIGDGTIECDTLPRIQTMMKLLLNEPELLLLMNEAILKAQSIGVYDGAYRVIELATKP